ncbi:MAG: geranylgeranylglyceryl/heptaprenylglyceryl phosphate synthase [Candidatus Methanomethylophilaceae archaeon]|jgi:phosphoglycerol geranylgeranyltransferase
MTVKQYLLDRMKNGTIHLTLIDPDKQTPEEAAEIALKVRNAGTDAIMIGGSTGVTRENLDATAKAVKESAELPTIYFPAGPQALSKEVDSIFFMSMVNSADPFYVIKAQAGAAAYIKKLGIEPISMGYIIIAPGMKVGEVGKADLVQQDEYDKAIGYALACEMLGMDFVYLEAGSGADTPVPLAMITAVRQAISIPLIVGGGIRTPEAAKAARKAGANAVVTGTFVERCKDDELLKSVIKASKGI